MPVITLESSVGIPAARRAEIAAELRAAVERLLEIAPPTQVRFRLVAVDAADVSVSPLAGPNAPWVLADCRFKLGRTQERVSWFVGAFTEEIARVLGIEARDVRVLVQEYPETHWGVGRTAAELARR